MKTTRTTEARQGSLPSRNLVAEATAPFWERAERGKCIGSSAPQSVVHISPTNIHKRLSLYYLLLLALISIAPLPFSTIRAMVAQRHGALSLSLKTARISDADLCDRIKKVGNTLYRFRSDYFEIDRVVTSDISPMHPVPMLTLLCHCGPERFYFLTSKATGLIYVIGPVSSPEVKSAPPAPRPPLPNRPLSRQQAIARARIYLSVIHSPLYGKAPANVQAAPGGAGGTKWVLTYGDLSATNQPGAKLTLSAIDGRFLYYWDKGAAFEQS